MMRMWRKENTALLIRLSTRTPTIENNREVPKRLRNRTTL